MAAAEQLARFLACIFVVHFFPEDELLFAEGLKRSSGEGFSYANFVHHPSHYLNITKVGSHLVHNAGACNVACVSSVSCFSFNVAARPDINGHFLCELLASDKYNSSDQFLPHQDFNHHSIYTPCSEDPCVNGGTCIALYKDRDFTCKCRPGFHGRKCQIARMPDCYEHYQAGVTTSGVYSVDPDGQGAFSVYCDMTTDGGGWTVFQRRQDGSEDFSLGWSEYKAGFGQLTGEFWLGLDKINRLTASSPCELRVDIEDWSDGTAYAKYSSFEVDDEQALYRLSVGSYSGTAGNSLTYHNNMYFTTKDRDNDANGNANCAEGSKGGWWYNRCHHSNLNGQYLRERKEFNGVRWYHFKKDNLSMKSAAMKLRRKV